MATRETIKGAFLNALQSAVSANVPSTSDNVGGRGNVEGLPAVVYSEMERKDTASRGAQTKPAKYDYNASGGKTVAYYPSYWVVRFDVQCKAGKEGKKETLYANVLSEFHPYDDGWLHPDQFHADVRDIGVRDQRDSDDESSEDIIRGDFITVEFAYTKWLSRDGEPIESVDHEIDADLDSSTGGNTYTTS